MEFIFELENNIPDEICKEIIDRFESDSNKNPGVTIDGVDEKMKRSTDLYISKCSNWSDIDNYLSKKLTGAIKEYIAHLSKQNIINNKVNCNFSDTGYQIQRTKKNGYYNWHNDAIDNRYLTFIWYLNTLDPEIDGGTTDFKCGKIITPKTGKLLLFPATWTYIHRGAQVISDNAKYICTGWICML